MREFYPGALAAVGGDLGGRDALAILPVAPTPTLGRQLSQAKLVAEASGAAVTALVGVITA